MSNADRIAEKLAQDWRERAPYETLTGALAPADLEGAYAAQRALNARLAADRGAVAGRKIALSSRAMQEMVGLGQPIAGAIHAGDIHRSPARIARDDFRHLGIEYELAFETSRDLGPKDAPFSRDRIGDVVATVRPAFELIEDRGADYSQLDGLTLAADNAWCGGIVLGGEIADWRERDLADLPGVLEQNGHPPEMANTGAADPYASFAWVIDHVTRSGQTIAAGEQIITGSVLRTRFPEAGDWLKYSVADAASVEIEIT